MSSTGGVNYQGFAVADIRQMAGQLDAVDKLNAGFFSTLDSEAQNCTLTVRQVFFRQLVVRVRFESRVVHPGYLRLFFEPLCQLQRVLGVPWHTQMQRFEPLQKQKRVERRHTTAHITEELGPGFDDVRQLADGLDVFYAVIARVRFSHFRVTAVRPVEFTRIDNRAADACAVPADEFRAAMNDNVDAVFEGPEKNRRGNSIVANHRHTVFMSYLGDLIILQDVILWIADGLDINQPGIVFYRPGKILRILRIDKSHFNAKFGESMAKERHRPAVKRIRGHNMTAGTANVKDAHIYRRLARTECQAAHSAFQGRQPLFQHVRRRIHQPGIDIAEFLQREKIGCVVRILKYVAGRLINRYGSAQSI